MLPESFCWTRIGTESGQRTDAILVRKEMERRTGGVFAWGIGNALGENLARLAARGAPVVAFSPIAGRAAAHDASPGSILAWRSYLDANRVPRRLPPGVLVTSRSSSASGADKARHYVLMCARDEPLRFETVETVDIGQLRNLESGRPVGASQTTAVVRRSPEQQPARSYPIVLTATLVPPYFAALCEPVTVTQTHVNDLHAVAESQDIGAWRAAVGETLSMAHRVGFSLF